MKIIIGTRGSKLALWQAEWVKEELRKLHPDLEVELKKIKTTGDKILDVPLAKVGGKGLFVKEIEEAILRHEADIAVHSMKDVPTEFPDGLHLSVICKREDPRDAFISQRAEVSRSDPQRRPASGNPKSANSVEIFKVQRFKDLPDGAILGTSSLRRSCQLQNIRPDLKIVQLRGNVDTRLRKLDEGQFDAIILAAAGLKRLGFSERITEILPPNISLPAIGQGAIGIECRMDDDLTNNLIAPLNHHDTSLCIRAERAFLRTLEGGCQVPIAAYANLIDGRITMDGLVGSISGDRIIKGNIEGSPDHSESLGNRLAKDMLSRGAREILEEVYGKNAPPINGEIAG